MELAQFKSFWIKYRMELLIFFLTAAVFAPSLQYGFQMDWDDSYYVVNNPYLLFTWENLRACFTEATLGLYTPITAFSFMLDRLIWGTELNAFGYRLTNILVHAGSAVLFARILKHLGIRNGLVFFCTLFWAIQPQRLESVVWIAERKDVLSGFFALASFYVFMKDPGSWKRIIAAILLFAVSLFSKPSAIGLPLAVMVYLCYWNPQKFKWQQILCGAAAAGVLAFAMMKILGINPALIPFPRMCSVVAHNALFYFSNGIFPWETNPCYPHVDWQDSWIAVFAAGVFFSVFLLGRLAGMTGKKIAMIILAFAIVFAAFFAPFTGAFRFNPTDYADRYAYFPNLAVWAFLGYFLEQIFRKNDQQIRYFQLAGCLLAVFTIGSTFWHMPFWKDSQTLARWAVYSYQYPNDRFLIIHAKTGFMTQDPVPILESLEKLKAKAALPELPRETEQMKKARLGTILVFEITADILQGNFAEATEKTDLYIANATPITLIDKDIYETLFKFLLMQMYVITKDEDRLNAFGIWGSSIKSASGEIIQDYSVTGFIKFHRKDYKGAIADWKKLLKKQKNAPEILENIRRAEAKLKETE